MFVCWPKNTGSTLNPQLHYPRDRDRGRERSCLSVCSLPLSSKSVLIKLCLSAGPRTHTRCTEREVYPNMLVLFLPFCRRLNHCLSLLPFFLSLRAPSHHITPEEWQAVFFSRCLNTERSMPDKGKERGWGVEGGATQLVIDSEFKVWKTGGDSLVRGDHELRRENRQGGEDCESGTAMNVIPVYG